MCIFLLQGLCNCNDLQHTAVIALATSVSDGENIAINIQYNTIHLVI